LDARAIRLGLRSLSLAVRPRGLRLLIRQVLRPLLVRVVYFKNGWEQVPAVVVVGFEVVAARQRVRTISAGRTRSGWHAALLPVRPDPVPHGSHSCVKARSEGGARFHGIGAFRRYWHRRVYRGGRKLQDS
jgi:hypothetical protein